MIFEDPESYYRAPCTHLHAVEMPCGLSDVEKAGQMRAGAAGVLPFPPPCPQMCTGGSCGAAGSCRCCCQKAQAQEVRGQLLRESKTIQGL